MDWDKLRAAAKADRFEVQDAGHARQPAACIGSAGQVHVCPHLQAPASRHAGRDGGVDSSWQRVLGSPCQQTAQGADDEQRGRVREEHSESMGQGAGHLQQMV